MPATACPEGGSGWPLWESFTDEYRRTGSELGLTRELSDALFEWNKMWSAREIDDPLPDGWKDDGIRLFIDLRSELSGIAEVRPEFLS